jgi:ribosomal-protein-alanine N-acetyltransferase
VTDLPDFSVELADGADAARLAGVHAACFEKNWSVAAFQDLMGSAHVHALVLRDEAKDVGFCLVRVVVDEAEILTIGVLPEHRRGGAGSRLLAIAEAHARKAGAARLFLEVSAENGAARGLYSRAGYSEIGQRRGYYAAQTDACVLEKTLSGDGQNGP